MPRAEIIRHAYLEYHAGRITLAELARTLVQWRAPAGDPPPADPAPPSST